MPKLDASGCTRVAVVPLEDPRIEAARARHPPTVTATTYADVPLANCTDLGPYANGTGGLAVPCPGNGSQPCGAAGAVLTYGFTCEADTTCSRNGTVRANGSAVSYQEYIDCNRGVDDSGSYVNDHFQLSPHFPLLCNLTSNAGNAQRGDAAYCDRAEADLRRYATAGAADDCWAALAAKPAQMSLALQSTLSTRRSVASSEAHTKAMGPLTGSGAKPHRRSSVGPPATASTRSVRLLFAAPMRRRASPLAAPTIAPT